MKILAALIITIFTINSCMTDRQIIDDGLQSSYIWPLCGRIMESVETHWQAGNDCPKYRHNAAYNDYPLSSTFGPRQKASEGFRYDYHRGIDLHTPINTPLFAIADGEALKAGQDPAFADPVIMLRHYQPATTDCTIDMCLTSVYMHINSTVISIGDTVKKGQLIGYSGGTITFPHLHFEIRRVIMNSDKHNAWQRDAVHPLHFLPLPDRNADNMQVSLSDIDLDDPLKPVISVTVSMDTQTPLDLNRIEIQLFSRTDDNTLEAINQTATLYLGNTPENDHYTLNPTFLDMELFNRQYSYKNSMKFPWTSFTSGGQYQSPFHESMPDNYDPNTHLDAASLTNANTGHFNGLHIAPDIFSDRSTNYRLTLTFNSLTGTNDPDTLCIVARAINTLGHYTNDTTYGCN